MAWLVEPNKALHFIVLVTIMRYELELECAQDEEII